MAITKLHTIYKNAEGKRLPGASTLKGQLGWSKESLMGWVKRVTLEGLDYNEVRRSGGGSGTLVHKFIANSILGINIHTNTGEFTNNEIGLAENSFLSFLEWKKNKIFTEIWINKNTKMLLVEQPFVSEKYQFGGTLDLYCDYREKGDDKSKLTLIDWKSGSGIFLEDLIQVVGCYTILLEENNYPVDQVILLNIPKREDDSFLEVVIDKKEDIEACQRIALSCKNIYDDKKIIRKIGGVR